jgi:hypothetical protein
MIAILPLRNPYSNKILPEKPFLAYQFHVKDLPPWRNFFDNRSKV